MHFKQNMIIIITKDFALLNFSLFNSELYTSNSCPTSQTNFRSVTYLLRSYYIFHYIKTLHIVITTENPLILRHIGSVSVLFR